MRRRTPRVAVGELESVWPVIRSLAPAALLVDVEPFVAGWGTDDAALTRGLCLQLEACASLEGLQAVLFVTNSRRQGALDVAAGTFTASYIARARKPFLKLRPLGLPAATVVVLGDQVLTDGLTAWRLGATFVQVPLPPGASVPVRVQAFAGRLIAWCFFRTSAG